MHGTFELGFPWIEIEIIGSHDAATKVKVIVDTGFNGYLSLPYEVAFPIGLTLEGVGSGKVADGTFSPYLMCAGVVKYGETRVRSAIDVQQGGRPLMGTALLKELGRSLFLDPVKGVVILEDVRKTP